MTSLPRVFAGKLESYRAIILGIVFISLFYFHFSTLLSYPAPFVDEMWYASRAWAYAKEGVNVGMLDRGVPEQFAGDGYFHQIIPTFFQALFFRFTSQPDLFQIRIISLIFGEFLALNAFLIGKRFSGFFSGVLCFIAVNLSWIFAFSGHLGRIDIITAAFGFTAINLYLYAQKRSWLYLLCGFVLGLALEVHLYGGIYILLLASLCMRDFVNRKVDFKYLLWLATGLLISLILYVSYHILPNPKTYAILLNLMHNANHPIPILSLDFSSIFASIVEHMTGWLKLYPIHWLLFLLSMAYFLLKGDYEQRTIPLFFIFSLVIVGSLIRHHWMYYSILVTPFIDISTVSFISVLFKERVKTKLGYLLMILASTWLIAGYLLNVNIVYSTDYYEDYKSTNIWVSKQIDIDESILASQNYWFALYQNEYYSWENLLWYKRWQPGSSLEEAMKYINPDVIIIDKTLSYFIAPVNAQKYIDDFFVPEAEWDTYLSKNYRLVARYQSPTYGEVEVYKILDTYAY